MEIGKITMVYFSPTGGTKKVVKSLREALEKSLGKSSAQKLEEIDITDYADGWSEVSFEADELVLFAVPVYGGRIPAAAAERLCNFRGHDTLAVLVAVYGNRAYDDALLELKNLVLAQGFIPAAGISANAEHSIMHQFGTSRPDDADTEDLRSYAGEISRKISMFHASTYFPDLFVKGNREYRQYNGVPLKPKADKICTRCGLCALKCPVHAISEDNPQKTDTDVCISCMRCIAICPSHARSVSRLKLAVASKAMEKACESRKENELFL